MIANPPGLSAPLNEEDSTQQARLFKALADPTRLRILSLLARNDGLVCVEEIAEVLDILQPRTSHHLRILMSADLLVCKKQGLHAYYRVNRTRFAQIGLALAGLVQEG